MGNDLAEEGSKENIETIYSLFHDLLLEFP